MKVSVVIPAYNEEATIGRMIQDVCYLLKPSFPEFEVFVMNDCSTDRTDMVARQHAEQYAEVTVVTNEKNLGKTQSLLKGFSMSRGEIVSFIDADYQYDPRDLPLVIQKVASNETDVCVGSRQNRQDNPYRLFMSTCFNVFNRTMFGIRIDDVNCGIKAMPRALFDTITIRYPQASWFFDTELLARAARVYRIGQVPIRHHPRTEGESKVSGLKLATETIIYGVRLKFEFLGLRSSQKV